MVVVRKTKPDSHLPNRPMCSAGYTLNSAVECTIPPGEYKYVDTGIEIKVPSGTYGRITSMGAGFTSLFGIDVFEDSISDDRPMKVSVGLINHSNEDFIIEKGHGIAQLFIEKFERPKVQEVDSFD